MLLCHSSGTLESVCGGSLYAASQLLLRIEKKMDERRRGI